MTIHDTLSTKPRTVTIPAEFGESVIVGTDFFGRPVERHAVDWFQGADGMPVWRFEVPGGHAPPVRATEREDFTSWRLVLQTVGGLTRVVKRFDIIRLFPGDSLDLHWSIHAWTDVQTLNPQPQQEGNT